MPKAAAIQAGANIAGQLLNQAFAEHNRERNYYWNEKAANSADARQRAQYQDLYSPQAQVQQLKEAGLSPSTMYGGVGSAGQSAGNMSMGASGPQAPYMNPIDVASIANIKAQTEKTKAETQEILGETDPSKANMELLQAKTAEALANKGYMQTSEEFNKARTQWQQITNEFLPSEKKLNVSKLNLELENFIHTNELIKWQAKREGLSYNWDVTTFDDRAQQIEADLTKTLNEGMLAIVRAQEGLKHIEVMDMDMTATTHEIMQGWRRLEIEDAGQRAQEKWYQEMGEAALSNAYTNYSRLQAEKGWKEKEFDLTKRGQNLNLATNLIHAFISSQNALLRLAGDIVQGIL